MKVLFFSLSALLLTLAAFHSETDAYAKAKARKKAQHNIVAARLPEARCDLIEKSVVADLPHFCSEKSLDQVRLIDFGNQLDLLEGKCGRADLALQLKKALNEKVHHKNNAGCIIQAESLTHDHALKAQASAPDSGF